MISLKIVTGFSNVIPVIKKRETSKSVDFANGEYGDKIMKLNL